MWHASIVLNGIKTASRMEVARRLAHEALHDVGDISLGQWEERTKTAWHLRRRLSVSEQILGGIQMRDLRSTEEGRHRMTAIIAEAPQLRDFVLQEAMSCGFRAEMD